MDQGRPLPEILSRLYFYGWVALSPLVIFTGLIGYVSYDRALKYFLAGLWAGLLNLGIVWTGIFILITLASIVISLMQHLIKFGKRSQETLVRTFREEFREVYGLGWTILIVLGFISEYFVQSSDTSGGLFVTLALGFLPMTLAAVLLAKIRSRA